MSAAIGVLMLVLMVALVAAKVSSDTRRLDDTLTGWIFGLGICAYVIVTFQMIARGAA